MAYPPISTLPSPPSRQDPANFSAEADAFLGALPTFQTQVNAAGTYIDGVGTAVDVDASAAAVSAAAAVVSANQAAVSSAAAAAAAASMAAVWVSGGSYIFGVMVFSPINLLTYRAKTTHSGLTVDPSLDATNWVSLSASSNAQGFVTQYTGGNAPPASFSPANSIALI